VDDFRALALAESSAGWAALAGVATAELERVAALYATHRPGAIVVGWGLGRRRNGSRTVRAIDALGAISGNLGVKGGGVSYYFARRAAFALDFLQGAAVAPRTLAEARLGHEIAAAQDPPIRAVWITAANPVSMLPDSNSLRAALARCELTVVVDTHPTDTTDCADLVLPTLTLLEDDDVLGSYGNHFLHVSRPALAPPGEARHELQILSQLAERLGVGARVPGSITWWKERVLQRTAREGVTLARLEQGAARNPFAPEVLFAGRRVPTPNGRVQLLRERADPPPAPDADYPLLLLSSSTPKAQSSQAAVRVPPGPPDVTVHPRSAAGLAPGAHARLESRLGALEVIVRHDDTLRRDVALVAKGGMLRDRRGVNALVQAVETDGGGGAAYYDEPVRLVPA
jgi:anaerobic selenocysteine-containing dehydrogenase